MNLIFWITIAATVVVITIVCIAYFSARYFFRTTILRKPITTLDNNINANTDWEKHIDFIRTRKSWLEKQNTEDIYIKSNDGLKLHATLLRCKSNNNCVICFHGYTSCGINDYSAISKFYYEQNFNVIMVDERAHGQSEGEYVGFGVLDRNDALRWIEYAVEIFGKEVNIFLHGDSMGGATVLMASGLKLPKNVKAIIADCAFTSAYDVFTHILKRDYHIPNFPIMNITQLMTKKKAGYGYKDVSTLDEVAKTNVPILFIHGDKDDFVPMWMSEKTLKLVIRKRNCLLSKMPIMQNRIILIPLHMKRLLKI